MPFPPPFAFVASAVLAWWIDARWPLRTPPGGRLESAAEAAGALLLLAGLAFDLAALIVFLRARTSPLPFRPTTAFVVRGPYRLSRNPNYVGMTLVVAGFGLMTGRLLLLPAAVLGALLVDRYVIRREKPYLEPRFGASYRDYRRRVRRWL